MATQPVYNTMGAADPMQNIYRASSAISPFAPIQMPGMPQGAPGFFNPMNPMYGYHDPGASTDALFQRGISTAAPSTGVAPGYQSILDIIKQQQKYAGDTGVSAAQSLAAKRGLTGSSIEQFGTQQALESASRSGLDATSNVLLQNQSQQNQLQQLQAQLYGNRATSLAGLNSDELASLRNADFAQRSLQLQQQLGQQGIDLSRENIGASRDIANQQARNNLIGAGATLLAPYLLPKLFNTGGGTPGFFNAGGVPGVPGLGSTTGGFTPYSPGGLPGPYAYGSNAATAGPGYFGAGGSLFNTAGTSSIGAGSFAGGLAGYYAGTKLAPATQDGDRSAENVGGVLGGVGGSFFGPAGSAAGAAAGVAAGKGANRLVNGIDARLGGTAGSIARYSNPFTGVPAAFNKVKEAFGMNSHTDTKGSDAWAQGISPEEYGRKIGTTGYGTSYDSNKSGSAAANVDSAIAHLSPAQLVARYTNPIKGAGGASPIDAKYHDLFAKGASLLGGKTPNAEEMAYLMQSAGYIA